jgi:sec-independent protein translocase protein TatA
MPSLGPAEILVVLVIALLVFGPNKMPDIAKQVGKGFREFRRVQQHLKSELRDVVSEFDSPTSATVEQQAVPMLPPKETMADDVAPAPAPVAEAPTPVADTPAPAPPVTPPTAAPTPIVADTSASLPSPEPDAPSESA